MMPDRTTPIDEAQLRRYLDRSGSAEDIRAVEAWLRAEPLAERLVRGLQETSALAEDVEAIWGRVVRETRERSSMGARAWGSGWFGQSGAGKGEKGRLGTRTLRHATFAGILAVGALSIAIFRPTRPLAPGITRTYVTTDTQQATLRLSDGSHVILAPHTTLRLVDFGTRTRSVELDGEAYFDVSQASTAPFVVRSGRITTRVLGTRFLVRYTPGDRRAHVAVESGKVHVTGALRGDAGVTLTAGQIGDATDSTVHVNTADGVPSDVEWMSGHLVFRHKPVATILQTLSRWYGYQFRYTDHTLAQRNVTMGISARSSAEALAEVERVLAVNLTVVGDTVTLVPQPTRPVHGSPKVRAYDVWTPTREVGR